LADERDVLQRVYFPWAVSSARQAKPLMCVWYEKRLEVPLEALRKELDIVVAPQVKIKE
jgi:ubiquinone biosynthesis protein Coq4